MIDIYNYLNSDSEKEYLQKINYKFSLLEYLAIIYKSNKLNIFQKIEIQKDIMRDSIANFDVKIAESDKNKLNSIPELHNKTILEIEDFMKNDGKYYFDFTLYGTNYDFNDDDYYSLNYGFDNFDKIVSHIKNNISFDFKSCFIAKYDIHNDRYIRTLVLNSDFEIVYVYNPYDSNELNNLYSIFDSVYNSIPVPFKYGDIVCTIEQPEIPVIYINKYDDCGDPNCYYYDETCDRLQEIFLSNSQDLLYFNVNDSNCKMGNLLKAIVKSENFQVK